jgi:prolyl oligopeptidase
MLNILKAAGSVAVLSTLAILLTAPLRSQSPALPPPPASSADSTSTVLHGTTVADPYQWLEDGASPATRSWIDAQQHYTSGLLTSRPGMSELRDQLRALVDLEEPHRVLFRHGRYFIEKKPAGQQSASIFVREGAKGDDKLLVDPDSLGTGHSDTVELLNVSADARILVYGVRHGGRDQLSIHFRDLTTGQDLAGDTLPEARYLYWALPMEPDDSSVFYVKFDDAGPRILRHVFGTPVAKDELLFGEQLGAKELLVQSLSPDGKYLLITNLHGASGATNLYLKNLQSGAVQTVVEGIDATFNGTIQGHTLFIETNWKAGFGQVFSVDVAHPTQDHWKLIVPEIPNTTIQSIAVTGDRLVANIMRDAHSELKVYAFDGKPQPAIPLPGIGSVDTLDADPDSSRLCLSYTSFQTPKGFYDWSPAEHSIQPISTPLVPPALKDITVEQVWYSSTGGARVPMFLAHRRGLKLDGNLPVLLHGYGGFTWSQLPEFSPEEAVWLERGGVYAIANIRGGNEFGEAWHRAGELDQKQNCFDDFANAARWLIANHYTQPSRLAIQGMSNGGLLVTASITQHPELFGAAIGRYPLIDMVRYERFSIARWWSSEYGSASDPSQFKTLYAYSPYHHVVKGTPYPAVLLITGDGDTRVDPSHARKMTAMLQSRTSSDKPVLLLYDSKSGHSGSLSAATEIEQSANELEFLDWQLHLPESLPQ